MCGGDRHESQYEPQSDTVFRCFTVVLTVFCTFLTSSLQFLTDFSAFSLQGEMLLMFQTDSKSFSLSCNRSLKTFQNMHIEMSFYMYTRENRNIELHILFFVCWH